MHGAGKTELFASPIPSEYHANSTHMDIVTKYPNAYYHEIGNADFDMNLKATFATDRPCTALESTLNSNDWQKTSEVPVGFQHVVDTSVVEHIQKRLNESPHFAKNGGLVQVVYKRVIEILRNASKMDTYLVRLETLLHRKNKFHAKHVEFGILLEKQDTLKGQQWEINVVSVRVVGIVFEDRFGNYPVEPNNPFDKPELPFEENPYNLPPAILMTNDEVLAAVQQQLANQKKWAQSEAALA